MIVGRGSADDKGQLMTFVEACRAWKQVHGNLPCRITILFEGEEESGSPSLKPFLEANAGELKADFALVCDTGMWDRDTPSICVGLRGLVGEEITVKAADRDLHSGLYGGAAANPIRILARVLADIHDKDGHITIPGFYDGVEETPSQILKSWETLGETAETFLGPVGLSIPSGEKGRSVLELTWARPTAEFNGIIGGYTGKGFKTVIAAEASAKVSFRLVHKQDPKKSGPRSRSSSRSAFRPTVPSNSIRMAARRQSSFPTTRPSWPRPRMRCPTNGRSRRLRRAAAAPFRLSAISRPISAWNRCWSGSASTTTASTRPTRNTSSAPSTRASAPGRGFSMP